MCLLKKLGVFLFVFAFVLGIAACGNGEEETADAPPEEFNMENDDSHMSWWNDAVFYEIFVRSFADSDGDGVGDFQGLIDRLDYLNDGDPATDEDLGITGIWLMPISESPSYHGYDVVDYYSIDQEYGDEVDFQNFLDAAHERGIKVIVDLVLNHTADEHPWFQDARDPGDGHRDYYIWSDNPPSEPGPWGQTMWHPDAGGDFYYGIFWSGMPDLNYRNPLVSEAMMDVARFWIQDMAVDGFRLDAIKYLYETEDALENVEETHQWLRDFYTMYNELNPDFLTVGEIWDSTDVISSYIGDQVDIAFEFDLASAILNSARLGNKNGIRTAHSNIIRRYPQGQYATFITNHDQNRVMSELYGQHGKGKLAAAMLLTSPGVPFIYYGEEVGMEGRKPDEHIRRPMQWAPEEETGGFTAGEPWISMGNDYLENNVELMNSDEDSLLQYYRELIRLRRDHVALRRGRLHQVATSSFQAYSYIRYDEEETIMVLMNLSADPIQGCELTMESGPFSEETTPMLLSGDGQPSAFSPNEYGGFEEYIPFDELPAQSVYILHLQ
ncbi:MAG: alpha-amylase family glycosyl hydrolase [Spirochaetia bacterium]